MLPLLLEEVVAQKEEEEGEEGQEWKEMVDFLMMFEQRLMDPKQDLMQIWSPSLHRKMMSHHLLNDQ